MYVPLRELWEGFNPLGVRDGVFVVYRGYIDESYDGAKQDIFALSCLIASGKGWFEMERAWKLHLAAVNKKLKKQGRPMISRYHAGACSGRRDEFKGWTHDERDQFVLGLFGIFKRVPVHAVGYDVSIDDLCEIFPEWAADRMGTAYDLLTKFVLYTIGEDYEREAPGTEAKITLFHDRTPKHDATILRAFNKLVLDSNFKYPHYFTTIAPLGREDCIALQPADLVAFEVFKEAERRAAMRENPRKSFGALLDIKNFGIHTKSFTRDILILLRQQLERDRAVT